MYANATGMMIYIWMKLMENILLNILIDVHNLCSSEWKLAMLTRGFEGTEQTINNIVLAGEERETVKE